MSGAGLEPAPRSSPCPALPGQQAASETEVWVRGVGAGCESERAKPRSWSREERPSPQTYELAQEGSGESWVAAGDRREGGRRDWTESGRPDREPECRGPRAAADRARGKRRAPREAESCGGAAEREAGPEYGARRSQTERAAQTGKWLRPPPSASPSSEKTGLKGTPGTSGSRPSPTADPPSSPPLTRSTHTHSQVPTRLIGGFWSESPTLSILHPIPPPLFP